MKILRLSQVLEDNLFTSFCWLLSICDIFGESFFWGREERLQVMERVRFSKFHEARPVRMPSLRCQLRVSGDDVSFERKWPSYFSRIRLSTEGLLLDADACNLLAEAVSAFHHVRFELQELLSRKPNRLTTFDRLVNWTASCSDGLLDPDACHQKSLEVCAALGDDGKAIPLKCLKTLGRKLPPQYLSNRVS